MPVLFLIFNINEIIHNPEKLKNNLTELIFNYSKIAEGLKKSFSGLIIKYPKAFSI
jgi:hypothetical protein